MRVKQADKKAKAVDPLEIAEEFAEKGLIPDGYQQEFAEELVRELRRETRRFGGDVAGVIAKSVMAGQLRTSYLAA